jgi:hypothetical protein
VAQIPDPRRQAASSAIATSEGHPPLIILRKTLDEKYDREFLEMYFWRQEMDWFEVTSLEGLDEDLLSEMADGVRWRFINFCCNGLVE